MSGLGQFMRMGGEKFQVVRDNANAFEAEGLRNHEKSTGRQYIGFYPEVEIKPGDVLIGAVSGDRFYVIDVQSSMFQGAIRQRKAYYETEAERSRTAAPAGGPVFNIQSAPGSIIGTQTYATLTYTQQLDDFRAQVDSTDSPDKAELQELVAQLTEILNNQKAPQKGILSRFASVIQRNSWVTGPLTTFLLHWITTK